METKALSQAADECISEDNGAIKLVAWNAPTSDVSASDNPPPPDGTSADAPTPRKPKALFNVDIDKLGDIPVKNTSPAPTPSKNIDVPSSQISSSDVGNRNAATTGELLEKASSVNVRRTSAINLDALVRGYNSQQTVAVANGMNELKSRVDIDSLFSQIDPGIVKDIRVIDGPYSSLYGPGFAFLVAELDQGQRFVDGFQGHASTTMNYGTNGGAFYTRENAWGGGSDYSAFFSYGLRTGNDYRTGGDNAYIPASYNKQDMYVALSRDLTSVSRLDFNFLRTEINNLELPGVVYDINNSTNNQFNIKYVMQEDKQGPEQLVMQTWYHETGYRGDASRSSKQDSFYRNFITNTEATDFPVNTLSSGRSTSMGTRAYATFGDVDQPQLTVGADYHRSTTQYSEADIREDGLLMYDGNLFGIPRAIQDDVGLLANWLLPYNDVTTFTLGGRLDYAWNQVNANDPVITSIYNPASNYYIPGTNSSANLLGMTYLTQRSQVTEYWTFSSGAAFAMRNATSTELYSDEPYVPLVRFGSSFVDGNSQLAPEKNFQVDLGVKYDDGPFTFGLRGYHSLIRDYILPVAASTVGPATGLDTHFLGRDFSAFPARGDVALGTTNADNSSAGYTYANIPWATLWGMDCTTEYRMKPWLSFAAMGTYVQGANLAPKAFVLDTPSTGHFIDLGGSDPLPNIYPLNGTLRVRLMRPQTEDWGCDFVTRLVATQNRVATTLAELPTRGFTVFSIRTYYRPREGVRLTAAVENVFNQSYTQHGSLAIVGLDGRPTFVREPGTSFFMGGEFTF